MKFIILGIPEPKQSTRARIAKNKAGKSFIQTYQNAEVKQDERNIKWDIKSQLPVGFTPLTGSIRIKKLWFVFPPVKSLGVRRLNFIMAGGHLPKSTKPDLQDNLSKGLFDAMQGVVFINDSQICEMENVKKLYGKLPRIEVELEEIVIE